MLKKSEKSLLAPAAALTIGFVFLILNLTPLFYEASLKTKVPDNRVMILGEPQYPYDYNVYLSKIRQGKEGRWTIIDKYTNQKEQKGVFLQMFYLLQGKVAKIFNLDLNITYHLVNVLTGFAWVLTIIYLNIFFLKKKQYFIPGIIISFLASSFPLVFQMNNKFWIGYYMGWWQEMDVLKRIAYIPHYNLNYIIIASLTILLTLYAKKQRKNYLIPIIVITFLGFFIHPSGSIVFLISWFLYHLVRLILKTYTKKQAKKTIFHTIILAITSLIPLAYLRKVTTTYPWKSLVDYDQNFRLTVPIKDYILALGPVFLTGTIAIIFLLIKLINTTKRKQENNKENKQQKYLKLLPLATWFAAAFLSLIGFKLFPLQSELRFVQTANHIPLAILTVFSLKYLLNKTKNSQNRIFTKITVLNVFLLIIFTGIPQVFYSLKSQFLFLNQKAQADYPQVAYPPQVTQPLKDFYLGLKFLEKNTNRNSVVLSQLTAGNYIPAYAGNFVYLGHVSETPNFPERETKAKAFYQGRLNQQQAKNFLEKENIDFVFYGPQEKENSNYNIKNYTFLEPVFQTEKVIIFKVEK